MTKRQGKSGTIDVKALLREDEEFLRALVRTALQEVLEGEMTEALGADKGERTAGRQGYRSGYYGRTLITRIGKLERRVPQDRAGRFSTELFERYQRSQRAIGNCQAGWQIMMMSRSSLRACLFPIGPGTRQEPDALSRWALGRYLAHFAERRSR
jgi:putative transposase